MGCGGGDWSVWPDGRVEPRRHVAPGGVFDWLPDGRGAIINASSEMNRRLSGGGASPVGPPRISLLPSGP